MADFYESTLRFVRALKAERVENREATVARRKTARPKRPSETSLIFFVLSS